MSDLLLRIGVSNLFLSFALAIAAWAVQTTANRPVVAHLLWLLVLAKLITPPVLTVPVVTVPVPSASSSLVVTPDTGPESTMGAIALPGLDGRFAVVVQDNAAGKTGLALLWLLGSACVLACSLVRICRFNRLLETACEVAPSQLQRVAVKIAQRLGLAATPTIYTTSGAPIAHGVVDGRARAHHHPSGPVPRDGCRAASVDRGPRAGPRPTSGSRGSLARMAGLCLLLVEPRGLVGSAQSAGERRALLRRAGSGQPETQT